MHREGWPRGVTSSRRSIWILSGWVRFVSSNRLTIGKMAFEREFSPRARTADYLSRNTPVRPKFPSVQLIQRLRSNGGISQINRITIWLSATTEYGSKNFNKAFLRTHLSRKWRFQSKRANHRQFMNGSYFRCRRNSFTESAVDRSIGKSNFRLNSLDPSGKDLTGI